MCLTRLVNNPPWVGGPANRHAAGRLSSLFISVHVKAILVILHKCFGVFSQLSQNDELLCLLDFLHFTCSNFVSLLISLIFSIINSHDTVLWGRSLCIVITIFPLVSRSFISIVVWFLHYSDCFSIFNLCKLYRSTLYCRKQFILYSLTVKYCRYVIIKSYCYSYNYLDAFKYVPIREQSKRLWWVY